MSDPIRKPDEFPSRSESILSDTIGLEGYSIETPSRSRIETLLIELKEIIGQGGGGSSTAYATSLEITMDEYFVMTATLKNKDGDTLGQVQTVDLPLESVVVNGSYDSINKNVVLTLENGNTVSFSVADLVSGLQTEITSNNKLDADLVDDTNSTHKFATEAQLAQIQINKTALDNKADKSTTYTKTEVDTSLSNKADKSTTYTKTEVDTALGSKQNTIDINSKLSADLVDDTNATHKFATAAQLSQIATNKNNILTDEAALIELVDGGAKNLWDFKNALYSGKSADASYIKTDTDITVTSNGAWSIVIYRVNGLITGQRYVWSVKISDYSVQSDTCRLRISSDAASQNPIAMKTIEGNGNMNVEFVGRPELYFAYYINFSATSYQNTYKASENMICTKAAWDISQTYQPYRPSYQEIFNWSKATNCLYNDTTTNAYFDVQNSYVSVYTNSALQRVVINAHLVTSTAITAPLELKAIAAIPTTTPLPNVIVSSLTSKVMLLKNNSNRVIALGTTADIASGETLEVQLEYTYF